MSAAAGLIHTAGSVLMPLDRIDESASNPRKHFDKVKLKELVESVKSHGIYQPILVRPMGAEPTERYELVFGARRLRAAKTADLKHIPAIVRPMNDLEVLEAQVVENQQREDVHPLEEADGYHALHTVHGKTVEQIAHAVGKSKPYIYGRMRLVTLCKAAREAFYANKMDVSIAGLVARLGSEDVQKKATEALLDYEPALGYADAKRVLEQHYMLELARAPFNTGDAMLVPSAGSCASCPKRTGNQRELFPDTSEKDRCTDPTCFGKKVDAHWNARASEAEEGGGKVLSGRAAKKLFPGGGTAVAYDSGYVDLDAVCHIEGKGTYRKVVGDCQPTLVRDPQGGIHQVVESKVVMQALKESGAHTNAQPRGGADAAEKRARASRKKLHALTDAVFEGITQSTALAAKTNDAAFWLQLIDAVSWQGSAAAVIQVCKRRGWQPQHSTLMRKAKNLKGVALRALFIELVLARDAYFAYSTKLHPAVADMAKLLGVDIKKIEKRLAADPAGGKKKER